MIYMILKKLIFGMQQLFLRFLRLHKGLFTYWYHPEKREIYALIKSLKNKNLLSMGDDEAYNLYHIVKSVQHIKGPMAELGVYKGGSAKIIGTANKNKYLFLFDTFEGLPHSTHDGKIKKGGYKCSLKEVIPILLPFNVRCIKGIFPDSIKGNKHIQSQKFSFVHLDADLYSSTKAGLEFFYPRMKKGGIILTHNYSDLYEIRQAYNEFFKDKKEPVIELFGSQALVVKL